MFKGGAQVADARTVPAPNFQAQSGQLRQSSPKRTRDKVWHEGMLRMR